MAKRKAKKRTGTRRRRRIGAVNFNPNSPLVQIGSAAAGFFLADKINPLVDKVTGVMGPKLVAAAQTGIGAALVFLKIGSKKTLLQVIPGGILAGAGVQRALAAFGVVNGIGGYQRVPVIAGSTVNGYGQAPVIGYQPGASLNGYATADVAINGSRSSRVMGAMGNGLVG